MKMLLTVDTRFMNDEMILTYEMRDLHVYSRVIPQTSSKKTTKKILDHEPRGGKRESKLIYRFADSYKRGYRNLKKPPTDVPPFQIIQPSNPFIHDRCYPSLEHFLNIPPPHRPPHISPN